MPESESVDGLAALLSRAEGTGRGVAPVDRWNPDHCGDIDIVIRADGQWLHEGRPIARAELVKLFATVLRRDADGETYLVTPAEKLRITVDDTPFLAVEMDVSKGASPVMTFRTNVGDVVQADADHPLLFDPDDGGFAPKLLVRGRLEARLTRAVAYEMAMLVAEDAAGAYVHSAGQRFDIPAGTVQGLA